MRAEAFVQTLSDNRLVAGMPPAFIHIFFSPYKPTRFLQSAGAQGQRRQKSLFKQQTYQDYDDSPGEDVCRTQVKLGDVQAFADRIAGDADDLGRDTRFPT